MDRAETDFYDKKLLRRTRIVHCTQSGAKNNAHYNSKWCYIRANQTWADIVCRRYRRIAPLAVLIHWWQNIPNTTLSDTNAYLNDTNYYNIHSDNYLVIDTCVGVNSILVHNTRIAMIKIQFNVTIKKSFEGSVCNIRQL